MPGSGYNHIIIANASRQVEALSYGVRGSKGIRYTTTYHALSHCCYNYSVLDSEGTSYTTTYHALSHCCYNHSVLDSEGTSYTTTYHALSHCCYVHGNMYGPLQQNLSQVRIILIGTACMLWVLFCNTTWEILFFTSQTL